MPLALGAPMQARGVRSGGGGKGRRPRHQDRCHLHDPGVQPTERDSFDVPVSLHKMETQRTGQRADPGLDQTEPAAAADFAVTGPVFRPRRGSSLRPYNDQQAVAVIVTLFAGLAPDTKSRCASALKTAASLARDRFTVDDNFEVDTKPYALTGDCAVYAEAAMAKRDRRAAKMKEKADAARSVEHSGRATDDLADTGRAGIRRGRAHASKPDGGGV
jgi:hypothetical protein